MKILPHSTKPSERIPDNRDVSDLSGEGLSTFNYQAGLKGVTDNVLIDRLARQVLHWGPTPDRFLTGDRAWIPKWKFNPLQRIEDAFMLLDYCKSIRYVISNTRGRFQVEVEYKGKIGTASGNPKPRTITLALARSLGLEV